MFYLRLIVLKEASLGFELGYGLADGYIFESSQNLHGLAKD